MLSPPLESVVSVRLICTDPNSYLNVDLECLPAVIGRGKEADVQIVDRFASRLHCEVRLCDGALYALDLDSGNGTLLNGEFITDVELKGGDLLTVGVTTFRVQFSSRALAQISDRGATEFAQHGT